MPTENKGLELGKVFFKSKESDELKELACYETKENTMDDAADATEYAIKTMEQRTDSITVTISRESSRYLQKMIGIQRITRKRFIKLLMSCRIQRNDATIIAEIVHNSKVDYSPITVQAIIEGLIKEKEQ